GLRRGGPGRERPHRPRLPGRHGPARRFHGGRQRVQAPSGADRRQDHPACVRPGLAPADRQPLPRALGLGPPPAPARKALTPPSTPEGEHPRAGNPMASARPFRFGIFAENARSRETLLETARRAEDAGYSTLLIRDHFIKEPFGHQLAPLAALATV